MGKMFNPLILLSALLIVALTVGIACGDDDDGEGTPTDVPSDTGEATETPGELLTDFGVSDTEIKLGQSIALSGNLASVYQPIVPTLTAYFDYVNTELGGVCGRDINYSAEDDEYSPAKAREVAQKLIDQDEIAAFVGNLGTPPNTGSAGYINDPNGDGDTSDGVPDLFIATGVNAFADAAALPWTVLFNPDYTSEGTILANYLNDNNPGESVATLYQNDDFGKSGRDSFVATIAADVVGEETYESTATDINSQLANLRNADPDVLYIYATPGFTARAYAYMALNDWAPQVVMSYVNSASLLASIVGGDNGVAAGFEAIAGAISNNYILDPIADADDPAIVEHTRILETYNGPPVGTLTVYAQAIAETAVETLEIACDNGDMTRAGIMAAAESIDGFHPSTMLEGINLSLSDTDHAAIQSLIPVEIQSDGTLLPLVDEPITAGG
ncbi:MAG TPA: ABC transporter substrate-binding protein [Dehalococcoidia bacterium]